MKFKDNIRRYLNIRIFLIMVGCIALVAYAISYFSGMNFWVMFLICFASIFINGLILDLEDRFPGGFLNPTKKQTGESTKEK